MSDISFAFHKVFDQPFDTGVRSFAQPYLLFASVGAFHVDSADRTWLLPPYRAALIQANAPVRIWSTAPAVSSSVLFASDLTPTSTLASMPALDCQVFRVSTLLHQMINYATQWDVDKAALDPASQSFFQALAHVVGTASAETENLWFPRARSSDLERAIAFTLETLKEETAFSEVARVAIVSERTLSRRFLDELGMSWIEFVQRARIVRATEGLVMGDASIAELAYTWGFSSASSFAQKFRQLMGETPTQYRQRLRAAQ
ncbi:AraC family transcriptional regulator [Solimicrobium silvestre]|uniref:Helix-turn-helix domain n=1 Tax=Solimicrobium silvestre TaxID=2099400 RepID=A0A2S9GW98_9BURK|nr:AraC family transcriptional regulator [Solimicrobium silvestre]PRC91999.1 Helix-turn-helix domain [Solimicrobium silvestre]